MIIFIPAPVMRVLLHIFNRFMMVFTFPGVVMHEISHRLACDIFGVPVYTVKYFQWGSERAGYVIHHKTDNTKHNLLIATAPFFINSILCMIFTFPLASHIHLTCWGFSDVFGGSFAQIILYWVGLSMGASAFPSNQDVSNIVDETEEENTPSLFISIILLTVWLLNLLSHIFINFFYAYGISLLLPKIIFG
jgi:hypothetical protein